MNNKAILQSGERLSFFKLFKNNGCCLEIPIIQRDYAQGRDSCAEVRHLFLDALYGYLDENKPHRDLDFVYGSVVNEENSRFVPLDGQQRLTTLFLLHWYLATISGSMDDLRSFLASAGNPADPNFVGYKSKFTYETRSSSKEFCDALLANALDLGAPFWDADSLRGRLSHTVRDCGWYYSSWDNDPTIQSMLTMLDAIHDRFYSRPEFYWRLVDDEKPIITFLYLNLKDFRLTDDLYIKMNSRGKPLTSFENFKAKFEQYIGCLNWERGTSYRLDYGDTPQDVTVQQYFSFKIDTAWANLFWNYRNITTKDDCFDDELMNFIRVIMANQYALQCSVDKDSKLEILMDTQVAKKANDNLEVISFHKYLSLSAVTKQSITYLIESLDALVNGSEKIKIYLDDPFYYDECKTFDKVLTHVLTLPPRVRFQAYLKYLITNGSDTGGLPQWMRVIHNLTENTVIDGAGEVEKAIKSVEKMLPYSRDILTFLRTHASQATVDFFFGRQTQEEAIKAHLIGRSVEWSKAVLDTEKHPYFLGQIAFLFEFSGILQYYEEHGDCAWPDGDNDRYYNDFLGYAHNASLTFDGGGPKNNADFLWEQAVLTKGDYLIYTSAKRCNLLSANTEYYSWKRLLRLPPSGTNQQETEKWSKRRAFVKLVFDDLLSDGNHLRESLANICRTKPSDWRKYFIGGQASRLIGYCKQGFIRIGSESDILLFRQSQQNHRHRELFSYILFLNANRPEDSFLPFEEFSHRVVKGGDAFSCAALEGWSYKRKQFTIEIYHDNETQKGKVDAFRIKFFKSKGKNKAEDYPVEISDVLDNLNYCWEDDERGWGFWTSQTSEKKTLTALKNLCELFNDLIGK